MEGKRSATLNNVCLAIGVPALWYNYDLLQPLIESCFGLWLAQFTFFIYAAHYPAIRFAGRLFLDRIGASPALQLLAFFLIPLVTIAACVVLALLLRWLMRPAYLLLTGNR